MIIVFIYLATGWIVTVIVTRTRKVDLSLFEWTWNILLFPLVLLLLLVDKIWED